MRFYLGLIFLFFVLFACKNQDTDGLKQSKALNKIQAIMIYDAVRVRKEPNTKSDVITILKKDATADIIQKTDQKMKLADYPEDYWYEINAGTNKTGWVFGALMEINVPNLSEKKQTTIVVKNSEKNDASKNIKWNIENQNNLNTSIITTENLIIFGCADNIIYAYDNKSGKLKWKVASSVKITEILLINDGNLLFYNLKNIYVVNIINGSIKWQNKPQKEVTSNFISDAQYIYYADNDPVINIIEQNSGKKINSVTINDLTDNIQVLKTGLVLYKEKNTITAIDNPVYKEK